MPRISRILTGLIIFYFVFLVGIYFWQERLIFIPSKTVWLEVKQPPAKEVFFQTPDKIKLHGYFIKHQPKDIGFGKRQKTILFCHGNGGNITSNFGWVTIAKALGYNIFVFDPQGYGESEGQIKSELGFYADGQVAYDYLVETEKIKPENIILWGHSLGGAVALELAQKNKANSLVMVSPFLSLRAQINRHLGAFLPKFVLRYKFENDQKIEDLKIPKLIIHGKFDQMIDFDQGKKLFEIAENPKQFLTTEGDHNNVLEDNNPKYLKEIEQFLEKY